MERPRNYEPYGGFSIVGIVLSDALPNAAYHPDAPKCVEEQEAWRNLLLLGEAQEGEEKH